MSFIQRTLRKAEDFLESFDENVANYSRKVALESSDWDEQLNNRNEWQDMDFWEDQQQKSTSNEAKSVSVQRLKKGKSGEENRGYEHVRNKDGSESDSTTHSVESNRVGFSSLTGNQEQTDEARGKSKADDDFTDVATISNASEERFSTQETSRQPVDSTLAWSEWRKKLAFLTKEKNDYARQLQRAKEQLGTLERELEEEKKRSEYLQEERDEQLLELESQMEQLARRLEEEKRNQKDTEEAYRMALQEREQSIKELNQQLLGMNEQVKTLQFQLAKSTEEYQSLHSSVHEEMKRLSEDLEQERIAHQTTRRTLQEKIRDLESRLFTFQEREAQWERNLFTEKQQTKDLKSIREALETQVENYRKKVEALEGQLQDMTSNKDSYEKERIEWLQNKENLMHELQWKQQQIQQLQSQLASLQKVSIEEKESNKSSVLEGNGSTRKENGEDTKGVELKLNELTESLLQKQREVESLRSTNRVLASQLETERRRASQLEAIATDAMQRPSSSLFSTGDWNLTETNYSGYRPLRIRRAPRIIQKALKICDRFFALCLVILRREPLIRFSLIVYLLVLNLFLFLSFRSSHDTRYSILYS